jgi:hypothetical protein
MGYDVRMIIGEVHPEHDRRNKPLSWVSVMATLDLCVIGDKGKLPPLVRASLKKKSEGYYWYADNGNTKVRKDCYGEFPTPVPLKDVLEALEEDVRNDTERYRRFRWALALIRSLWETESEHKSDSIKVLFYGH